MPNGEIYNGSVEVARSMQRNRATFADFRYDVERLPHADEAIIVKRTFALALLRMRRQGQKTRHA